MYKLKQIILQAFCINIVYLGCRHFQILVYTRVLLFLIFSSSRPCKNYNYCNRVALQEYCTPYSKLLIDQEQSELFAYIILDSIVESIYSPVGIMSCFVTVFCSNSNYLPSHFLHLLHNKLCLFMNILHKISRYFRTFYIFALSDTELMSEQGWVLGSKMVMMRRLLLGLYGIFDNDTFCHPALFSCRSSSVYVLLQDPMGLSSLLLWEMHVSCNLVLEQMPCSQPQRQYPVSTQIQHKHFGFHDTSSCYALELDPNVVFVE